MKNFLGRVFSPPSGHRPALSCEIAPEGVLAARRASDGSTVTAFAPLPPGAVTPGLAASNLADVDAVVSMLRNALEEVAGRERSLTLVVPDAAVRVLLPDFDSLPPRSQDAAPILRFRLRKLVPFDVDDAALGYQVLSRERQLTRVLVAVMPSSVRAEYESAVRKAGFTPGALLPSTLAALAALSDSAESVLALNRSHLTATTAIVRAGDLLLHRSLELSSDAGAQRADLIEAVSVSAAYFEDELGSSPTVLYYSGPGGAGAFLEETGRDLPANLSVRDLAPVSRTGTLTGASAISTAAAIGALANG